MDEKFAYRRRTDAAEISLENNTNWKESPAAEKGTIQVMKVL
jgi:hypothetical protein